ncbi:cation transport ATPase [Legionella steigerwaltii]|uniref:Cation transport ATPase n=1 Tax=Legionella steigerwaltii TaxID=460 RepID=A0A378L6U0_9GAMM|nr:HAD-IC family P-type ATPase [Legionella steigerwaltii]KTD71976.1 cation transport ATPase [Legionella steigerwaltii]STY21642.1 cation transport ATPase [Legionella steigerwaltii]
MYLNYYRFRISSDAQLLAIEQAATEKIEQILHETADLKLVRVSIDLTAPDQSISLLCKSPNAKAIQASVSNRLMELGITLTELMETETLWYDEGTTHEGHIPPSRPVHSEHIKKKRKKRTPHNHAHDHSHDHAQDHSHDHAHDHSHGHAHDHSHDHAHDHSHGHAHDHSHGHAHDHSHGHAHDHSDGHHGHENHWLKAALGLIWGIGLIALSIASFNIPLTAYILITGLTSLMTLYLGYNVYKSAWYSLLEKKWDSAALYTISTLTIVAVSIASMFIPGLPMMFEAAPLVLGFWHLGEGIEHTLVGEIQKKLDVRDCLPSLVLLKGNPDREILVKNLISNDKIIIKKGEVIPVDGILMEKALLYTTRVDGSPDLKEFNPGDEVLAGMRLADHIPSLAMRATKTYQKSYLSLIAENIAKANNEKAPVEQFANTVLKYFVPGLLTVALVSGIVIGSLFNPALAIQCVISVLVSACPCALSLITPMAVKIGMKKASENGIHFNNGKALQAAADIDIVVFDLNGTLTQGNPVVQSLQIDNEKFLPYLALLESQSDHPSAKKIKLYIEDQGIVTNEQLKIDHDSIERHHAGIKAEINGETFIVGNKNMLLEHGVDVIDEPYNNPQNGSVYMVHRTKVQDKEVTKVIGQIALFDPLREDAFATVAQLKELGKTIHICTGADQETAKKYAALLDISPENIRANTVGAITKKGQKSKSDYIKALQDAGYKVAMVGDAANDDTAIAKANVGIAVKSSIGDTATQQNAGIVILEGLLFPIATAFDISAKTKQNIAQNLFVSLTYNSVITLVAAGLFVAIGFALNPAIGVALMVLESAIVLTNLYLFKQQEVVLAEQSRNTTLDAETPGDSTFDVLNSLGYRSQPKASLDTSSEPQSSYIKNLFSPGKPNHSHHSPKNTSQESLFQLC